MINNIAIKNFRSIEATNISLAPITVLYGPTSSGKSSLLYAFQVLRNFAQTPNRQADGFFNLGFMDLGGFEACVFNHQIDKQIGIAIEYGDDLGEYCLKFGKTTAEIHQRSRGFEMEASVSLPYGFNQTFAFPYQENNEEYTINWNGSVVMSCAPKKPTVDTQQRAQELAKEFNSASELLRSIDMIPHRRGFFKPIYTTTALSPTPTSEDEVASIIINDQYLPGRISTYAEQIFNRDFRTYNTPGTAAVSLLSTEKKSRIPVNLVNEGFGINQVIYMLAKMLRPDVQTVLIEEPEIHLHPTIIRNFARALLTVVKEEGKQVICATHGEQFLVSLLTTVAEGLLEPEDIACYLTSKSLKKTEFLRQEVNKDGQVSGGLTAFMEAETEDLKRFIWSKKKDG